MKKKGQQLNLKRFVYNTILILFAIATCIVNVMNENSITLFSLLQGMFLGGATWCMGYLGGVYFFGDKVDGKKQYGYVLIGFILCFVFALLMA